MSFSIRGLLVVASVTITAYATIAAAQVKPVPPYVPPVVVPPVVVQPPILQPPVVYTPPPVLTPPVIVAPPPGPPSTGYRGLPACDVSSTSDRIDGGCRRYIPAKTLRDDLYKCTDGRCYATKFLQIASAPIVVEYPQAAAARAEARAALMTEMKYGAAEMGKAIKTRIAAGVPGLPSIGEVDSLVSAAVSEVDRIDLPTEETPDEQRRRLGLGSSLRSLAEKARP